MSDLYYHCIGCNTIYSDKERTKPIVRFKTKCLPRLVQNCFNITSGLCKKCELQNNNRRREFKRDLYGIQEILKFNYLLLGIIFPLFFIYLVYAREGFSLKYFFLGIASLLFLIFHLENYFNKKEVKNETNK